MSKQKVTVSVDSEWLFAKHEAELREQIANEIETASIKIIAKDYVESELIEFVMSKCAAIARGQK